jgi:T5SS/PEP-CTERM-associated repeat protein
LILRAGAQGEMLFAFPLGRSRMRQHSSRRYALAALVAASIGFSADNEAATRSWVNGSGGGFSTAANWSALSIPGSGDVALFDLADPGYTVSFSSDPTNLRLSVADDIVTFDLNAHTYNLTNTGATASVIVGTALRGNTAVARLTIQDGTLTAVDAKIADSGLLNSGGTLVLGNAGNLVLQNLYVGSGRPGTFSIQSGGHGTTSFQASVGAESVGTALISGAGATWNIGSFLDIGVGNTGRMDISAGGIVSGSFSAATIGLPTGISGTVNVTGTNSKWSPRSLIVGGAGSGVLNISSAGSVGVVGGASFMTVVGDSFGGSGIVTVDGAGSRFQVSELRIGNFGLGQLQITGGATVSSGQSHIGYTGLGAGTVTLTGTGSTWSTSNLFVGGGTSTAGGPGVLTINPGTTLTCNFGKVTIWSTGTVNLSGGTITTGTMQIASGGHLNWSSGTLWITNSSISISSTGMLGNNVNIGTDMHFIGGELRIGQGGIGSLTATGGGEVSMANIVVGDNATGRVDLTRGAKLNTFSDFTAPLVVGNLANVTGTVNVDGAGTVWNSPNFPAVPGYLYIGRSGKGNVTASNGASLNFAATYGSIGNLAGSQGSLTLSTGAHAALEYDLFVGEFGAGSLAINSGADLTNTATTIAHDGLSTGLAVVDGVGSKWTMSGAFVVGNFGSAALTVSNGGSISAAESYVSLSPGSHSSVTVTGAGSSWTNDGSFGYLIVGGAGHGSLAIEAAGSVHAKETFIGDGDAGNGTILVNGTGSSFITDTELSVGYFGSGTLLVTGGSVTSAEGFIAAKTDSHGYARVQGPGSIWTNTSTLDVGFNGAGTLIVSDHGVVNAGTTLTVGPAGLIQYNGGTINTSTLALNAGGSMILSPGGDKVVRVNKLIVAANAGSKLDLADNDMIIDYTGGSPVATIQALLQNARAGGTWTGAGITSSAANASTFALGFGDNTQLGKATFDGQSVDPTCVLVKFTYYGDANLDGQVDVSDLGALASHWQSGAMWPGGDFDYDGSVNVNDLGLLASNWQAGVGNPLTPTARPWALGDALAAYGLPSNAVPEPMCLGLVSLAILSVRRRR